MCEYPWMSALGNYSLLGALVAVAILAVALLLMAIFSREYRRAALAAACTIAIPVCIIPIAAVMAFATLMGHQMACPGLFMHSISAALSVSALVTAIGCPLAGWQWAMHSSASISGSTSAGIPRGLIACTCCGLLMVLYVGWRLLGRSYMPHTFVPRIPARRPFLPQGKVGPLRRQWPSAPTAFQFYNPNQPVEPGWRTWQQRSATTWMEFYPSGRQTEFSVVGRAEVEGDKGTLLLRQPDRGLYVFVPNKDSHALFARFKQSDGTWMVLGTMVEVR